jgi:hypothetical protein
VARRDEGEVRRREVVGGQVAIARVVRTVHGSGGGADRTLELTVSAGGGPWATYVIAVHARDGGTVLDVEWSAERRFGLRRFPSWSPRSATAWTRSPSRATTSSNATSRCTSGPRPIGVGSHLRSEKRRAGATGPAPSRVPRLSLSRASDDTTSRRGRP